MPQKSMQAGGKETINYATKMALPCCHAPDQMYQVSANYHGTYMSHAAYYNYRLHDSLPAVHRHRYQKGACTSVLPTRVLLYSANNLPIGFQRI